MTNTQKDARIMATTLPSSSRLPHDVVAADVLAAISPEHGAPAPANAPADAPPPTRSNAASITEALRDEIFADTYPLGSHLPTEEALCTRFGISRGPIRQAIANLREEGLISSGRGHNTRIVRTTPGTSVTTLINHTYLPIGTTPELTDVASDIDQATGHTRLRAVYWHNDASGGQIAHETVEATLHPGANIIKQAGTTELIEAVTEGAYMPNTIAAHGVVDAIDVECAVEYAAASINDGDNNTNDDAAYNQPATVITATATNHKGEVAFISTTRVYVPVRIGARVTTWHTSSLQLRT